MMKFKYMKGSDKTWISVSNPKSGVQSVVNVDNISSIGCFNGKARINLVNRRYVETDIELDKFNRYFFRTD